MRDAFTIVNEHLKLVQNRQAKELAKAIGRSPEAVQAALDFIKTLDPRPGQRYNKIEPRLIEPDVAFIKQGDEYLVLLNDDDVPQLRLNPTYRRLLNGGAGGERCSQLHQREVQVRHPAHQEYRAAQADHLESLLRHHRPAARIPGQGNRLSACP